MLHCSFAKDTQSRRIIGLEDQYNPLVFDVVPILSLAELLLGTSMTKTDW